MYEENGRELLPCRSMFTRALDLIAFTPAAALSRGGSAAGRRLMGLSCLDMYVLQMCIFMHVQMYIFMHSGA